MNIKSFLAFILMSVFGYTLFSQDSSRAIDSLNSLLRESSRSERVSLLCELSVAYTKVNSERALYYASQALTISRDENNYTGMARSTRLAAKAYKDMGELEEAIELYEDMLPVCRRQKLLDEEILILNSYALALTHKAQYDKALKVHFDALNLQAGISDSLSMSITLNNVGLVYYKLKQYNKALQYFERCYTVKRRLNDEFDMDLLLINKGICHAYLGQYGKAEVFVDQGIANCKGDCDQRIIEAMFAKGVIQHGLDQIWKAYRFFRESLALAQKSNEIRFQLDNIYYLSEIEMMRNNPGSARMFLERGEELVRYHPDFNLERIKLYRRLTQLYRTIRDFRRASDYQLKYMNLKDSVYSADLTNNLMRIEAEHLEKENLAEIASQRQIILFNEEIIRSQNIINQLLMLVALVSAVLIIMIFRNYHRKKKANILLDLKIEERTRELLYSNEQLMKRLSEHELFLARIATSSIAYLNAIAGLCITGLKEISDSVGRTYLLRIEGVANEAKKLTRTRFDLNEGSSPDAVDQNILNPDNRIEERRK